MNKNSPQIWRLHEWVDCADHLQNKLMLYAELQPQNFRNTTAASLAGPNNWLTTLRNGLHNQVSAFIGNEIHVLVTFFNSAAPVESLRGVRKKWHSVRLGCWLQLANSFQGAVMCAGSTVYGHTSKAAGLRPDYSPAHHRRSQANYDTKKNYRCART